MKCITAADRAAAALRARKARAGKATKHATAGGTPNYFGPEANYANSPLIPKFVESLPGLGSANANTAGNFIPIAMPDQTTFPGSDYYQIQLNDYFQKMLTRAGPATLLRGYQDINSAVPAEERGNHYLGPLIIAHKDRPVRVLFKNALTGAGALDAGHVGNLFIPVDTSIMGADGPQNRATLHLHGGNTPWISDGTPHQWITPDGQRGASQQNVPDMPVPPSDSATFFWPNTQQSGRLMFYHDHAYGTTRLNVYAGSAAGYLLVDPIEDGLIANGVLPSQGGGVYNYGIPLIIQEKTFVDPANIIAQDPTWNSGSNPGTPVLGDLWFPHVYVPNQNPVDPEGVNAVGRWDYGPWFWPPQDPSSFLTTGGSGPNGTGQPYDCPGNSGYDPLVTIPTCPGIPLPSITPEAFGDTPLVNGQAYPYVTVAPTAYRFRILNASNDRSFNLQLYYAADTSGGGDGTPGHPGSVCRGAGNSSTCTEVNMVPATPPSGTPALCATPTQTSKSGLALGALDAGGNPLNGTGLPAGCWPTTWPTDGRDGGVPDPANAGPALIQIGTEGGILPSPVVIPATPVGYEYNRKSVVVLNVSNHGLLIGPAERADVIIDFSSVPAGSTLILYNDSPAAIPAFDPRLDYYTGDPDQSPSGLAIGGAPSTRAGFGPNTRTVMQFRVAGDPTAPFNLAGLTTQLQSAYAGIQPVPVVPETAYNAPFPGIAATDTYAKIQDNTLTFTPPVTPPPPYAGPSCPATTGKVCAAMLPKAIQELFTLDYGRMNATLGVELPFTRFNVQTTIPYGYIDPPTEFVTEGQPQLWKITHNGVDTHFIHFHLFDVQVINRVGWDGQVRAPDANEVGWKDTVRMNPLEDIVVALQPVSPAAPFPVPTSNRLLDVTMPEGAVTPVNAGGVPTGPPYFTNFDPANLPTTTVNTMTNFGWEYVWHCHILGHEENDMMRPIIFTPKAAMLSPVPGTGVLATSPIPFTWNANPPATSTFGTVTTNYGVSAANLCIGSVLPNTCDLYQGKPAFTTGDTVDLSSKPIPDGTTVFVSLFSTINGVTLHNDYTYVIGNPVASASPASLDLGSQLVKTAGATQSITVSSGGQAPLTVKNVTMTGLNPGDFVITNGCTVVPTGTNCSVGVTFVPAAMGARAGTLNIDTNDPVNPLLTVSLTGVGLAPVAGVTPASVTFTQPQPLNTASPSQNVTLSNTGTSVMTIVNLALAGANAGDFVQTGTTCGATLAVNGTCTISIAFKPSVSGLRSATLAISTSDPFNPTLNVALSGTGAGPIAGVSPASLSFGNQGVATTGAPQSVTVSNTGTASMSLTGVVVTGDFVQTGSTCGTTLQAPPAANTCTISVAFAPSAAGARAGSVTISTSDTFHAILTVSLGGTGVVPLAVLSPLALTYPIQLENTTSPAQSVQLSNTGAWPLAIAGVAVSGANAAEFKISANSCTGSLAAGASCAVSVTFTPVAAGNRVASLTFTDNSNAVAGSVQSAALSGSATGIAISPPVLAFGNQALGTTSNSRTVTVTNANTSIRTITSVSITGPNAVDFLLTNGCTGTLNPGKSCNVTVRFKPSINGLESASLSIATSDPFSPSIVPMSGTGTGPVATLSPTSWNFGTVTRGQVSASQTFTVTNTGNGTLTFSNNAFSLSGNNASQFRLAATAPCVGGGTLAPGASCSVTVSFAPTRNSAAGVDTATLNVRDNAPGSPQIATLTGTAQ